MAITVIIAPTTLAVSGSETQFTASGPFVLYGDGFAEGERCSLERLGPSGTYIKATNEKGAIKVGAYQTATKTYAASGNYTVKVYAKDGGVLTQFKANTAGMSGTLSLPSGMTYFRCASSNTLSGTLNLPSEMTYFNCQGSNTLSGYTPSAKARNQSCFFLTGQNTLSATDVDNILIDYAAAGGTWVGSKILTIQGNAADRTSASDAAYASLATKLTTLDVD